ncbi:MAG: RNA polymerase sigma factor [Coriobacteriia bacterium]
MSTGGISTTLATLRTRRVSDEACLASSLAGDPIAFSEFYRRYHTRIRGYLLARLMDSHAAEDATQEVFLRVLKTAESDVRDARAWLFTVASNVAADGARRRSARPTEVAFSTESPADIPTGRDSASEILDRETARSVFTALRRLAPRQRTALILRELHGQSSADIAESLGTSTGNADVLVSRARDAFGVAYAEVSDLPNACREAVGAIYREMGTGISDTEATSLGVHTDACPRCAAEYQRAHSKRYLPALLPFLVPGAAGNDLLARASVWLRAMPEAVFVHIGSLNPTLWSTPAKLGAASIALALTLTPAVGAVRASAASPTLVQPKTPLSAAAAPTVKVPDDGTASAVEESLTGPATSITSRCADDTRAVKLPDACADGTRDGGTFTKADGTTCSPDGRITLPTSSEAACTPGIVTDPTLPDCGTPGDCEPQPGTPRR